MGLTPVYGHRALLDRLAGAIASSRFPQAVLLTGPRGVGKQRLALWVAQGLLCEGGPAAPCGECQACQMVNGLRHPDLHWFVPIPRPKADTDRQIAEAAETLGEVIATRRERPLWTAPDGLANHSLASVRLLQRAVSLTPAMGHRKVILLGDAERLVVQEDSPAANAMLKVLEEPPANTTLLLTTSEAQALLPTIRSRVAPIRVQRLSDQDVGAFLSRELDPPLKGAELEHRIGQAEGSIGRALERQGGGQGADHAAERFLAAVRGGPAAWARLALGQIPWSARGEFTAMLDALALRLRAEIGAQASQSMASLRARVAALQAVESIRADAQGNVNPQLAMGVLAGQIGGR